MATKPDFCTVPPASNAVAGKDILLMIWIPTSATEGSFVAIAGQQGFTLNRTADSIEVNTKDTAGGWKQYLAGMKEWSIDTDGLFAMNDSTHQALETAFIATDPVCVKVVNNHDPANPVDMYGGLAVITDYSLDAPYDDAATYSLSLAGRGTLVDLSTTTEANG